MNEIQTTTVSEAGFATTSQIGDFELSIDATNEAGPNPNAVLVADYAACFLPALRVGAQRTGVEGLGTLQLDAEADLDDGEDITGIRFTIRVGVELSDEQRAAILEQAEQICHVHAALRDELAAEITLIDAAF
jgi:organic hydroperoxide reductase OsmC/OhrA